LTVQEDAIPTKGPAPGEHDSSPTRRTPQLLRDFVASETGPRISLSALRDALDDRGFGVMLFVFAFPNLLPHNIPLVSAVLGVPLVLLAAQLSYGRHKPWFPSWLADRSFPRLGFTAIVMHGLPYLERAERLLKPRLSGALTWTGERLIGVAVLVLAVALTLPIPFGNLLPALAIAIIGVALVEKDGVAVLVGLAVGVASLVVIALVVGGLVAATTLVIGGLLGSR
jgi:hypothetical protein